MNDLMDFAERLVWRDGFGSDLLLKERRERVSRVLRQEFPNVEEWKVNSVVGRVLPMSLFWGEL